MPLAQWLLDILVCPVCRTPVAETQDHASLRCETCRRVYPIVDDIPNMLVSEAALEDTDPKPT